MSVSFIPSQLPSHKQTPLPWTANPRKLLVADLWLCLSKITYVPGIFLPWRLGADASPWDELYPSLVNIKSIILHCILVIGQIAFLVSLPFSLFFPSFWFFAYILLFIFINGLVTKLLNGNTISLDPQPHVLKQLASRNGPSYDGEYWMYMNGVSVGKDWLQSNINRLTLTFGRPVHGVLNPTDGIVFDLLQCLIQRNLSYATSDIREAYASIKNALYNPKIKKVVFILHSQGGIEGGLIIDWLLAEVPQDNLRRLEVYTFGNAANHFNNPQRGSPSKYMSAASHNGAGIRPFRVHRAIGHIEHYANQGDFVSEIGVLNSVHAGESVRNRFIGRVFISPGSGHLLNQHYLHQMFALDDKNVCLDHNDFMDMDVDVQTPTQDAKEERENTSESITTTGEVTFIGDIGSPTSALSVTTSFNIPTGKAAQNRAIVKVKQLSRLWLYRNGGNPPDIDRFARAGTI